MCHQIRTLSKQCHIQRKKNDKNKKICLFWGWEFLSQKYEQRVLKFSFYAKHHFKAELYPYISVVIFGKHLSELYLIVLICF